MAKDKNGKGGEPRWKPRGEREVEAMSPDELEKYAREGVAHYARLRRKAEKMQEEARDRMLMEVGRAVLGAVPLLAVDPKKSAVVVSDLLEFASANRAAFEEWKESAGGEVVWSIPQAGRED